MTLQSVGTSVSIVAAIVATIFGLWKEFKSLPALKDTCNDSSIQLVGLINTCTDWCQGE